MDNNHRIALLIDADNVSSQLIPLIMPKLLSRGKVPIRRAYANWRKKGSDWDELACRYAIKGVQQFDPVSGKNATDQALTIDTMDLLHSGLYDTFAIVSGDGDFTPLAIRLREAGVTVLGFATKAHASAFAHACDHFEEVVIAEPTPEPAVKQPAQPKAPAAKPKQPAQPKAPAAKPKQPAQPKTTAAKKQQPPPVNDAKRNKAKQWFVEAFEQQAKNDKGCVLIGMANTYIRDNHSDYNLKELGFTKPSAFLKSLPQDFELQQGNATYRLKSK